MRLPSKEAFLATSRDHAQLMLVRVARCHERAREIIVAGHSPHKETVLVLRADNPEFFDCRFQR
jgi:hypothetical protein